MIALLGTLVRWTARHFIIFLLIVVALVLAVKIYEAYTALPALADEMAALEKQQALLEADASRQIAAARQTAERLDDMERSALRARLVRVRAQIAAAERNQGSRAGFALDAMRGDTDAIARDLGAAFRLQLLQREEAAIVARLGMIERANRLQSLAGHIRRLDARAAALERRIASIERRYPLLSQAERIPLLQTLRGPWRDLGMAREELRQVQRQRQQAVRARRVVQANLRAISTAFERHRSQLREAAPAAAVLQEAIDEKRAELSRHWATRLWEAARPVLGWAMWITLLVILVPPATKAFWYFVVAPAAARLRPIIIRPDLADEVAWAPSGDEPLQRGSGVSRRVVLHPGEELIIKPEYLQSSMNEARIDSTLVLSSAIPLGSLATGLIGLTRIRVHKREVATVSATQNMLDEVGILYIAEGSGLIFKPRNLVGVLQRSDRPLQIRSVWRLGHLSAWLTLQLRFLLFEGPCSLLVKGARGVALESATGGRRVAGAATMGWTPGLAYSVRRSETFLAYLTGKQSLFNDSFAGENGKVVYEELPRAGTRSGLFGRGLEGLGDGLLKVMGL